MSTEPVRPLQVSVRVNADPTRFSADLSSEAQIATNYEALNEGIATNPGKFAIWAVMEANARKVHDALVGKLNDEKIKMSELESALTLEFAGTGTIPVVAAKVAIDPRRVAKQKELQVVEAEIREAKSDLELLAAGRKTMEQKRDSLLALASNWRQEMQNRIQLRAEQSRPGAPGQDRPQSPSRR